MHVCTCLNASIQRSIEETQTRLPSLRPVLCSEFDDCPGSRGRAVRFAIVDLGTSPAASSAAAPSWARPWRSPSQAAVLVPREAGAGVGARILRWSGVAAAVAVAGVLGAVAAGRPSGAPGPAPERPTLGVALAGDEPRGSEARAVRAPEPLAVIPARPALAAAPGPVAPAVVSDSGERQERARRVAGTSRAPRSEDDEAPVVVPTGPNIHGVAEGLARLNAAAPPYGAPAEVNRAASAGAAPTGASLAEQLQAAAGAAAPPARVAAPAAADPSVMRMLRVAAAPEGAVAAAPPPVDVPSTLSSTMIARWLPGIRAQARACVERFGVPRQLTEVKARVSGATGAVAAVEIVGALAGTPTGKCIELAVRKSRLPRFGATEQVVTAPVVTP